MTTDVPLSINLSLTALLACLGFVAWLRRRPSLSGTTLVTPWHWTLFALIALAVGQSVAAWLLPSDAGWASHARYLSAVCTLCPAIAVLGCKRPQDRGWQLIVFSLLVVMALPSIESTLHRPDNALRLHGARQWFLVVLVLIGLFNGLLTRHGLANALVAASQVVLLIDHWPWPLSLATHELMSPTMQGLFGLALWVTAMLLVGFDVPRRRAISARPLDRLWLDFRDMFGVVWALRVADRINADSQRYGWGVRLGWRGLLLARSPQSNDLPPEVEQALMRSLRSLLRRFVSPEWISQRL